MKEQEALMRREGRGAWDEESCWRLRGWQGGIGVLHGCEACARSGRAVREVPSCGRNGAELLQLGAHMLPRGGLTN